MPSAACGLMEATDAGYGTDARPFILFSLDLDGFKPVNDSLGHQAGNRILRAVANRMLGCVRPGDIVSRLGGDGFVIVAPDMSPAEGNAYANWVTRCVSDERCLLDGISRLRIGISIGFAYSPEDGSAGDDLHRKADAALYEAMATGNGIQRRFRNTPPGRLAGRDVLARRIVPARKLLGLADGIGRPDRGR